jgi:transposase-like protein
VPYAPGSYLLSEETIAGLEHALGGGATYEKACDYVGIDPSTLGAWRRRGRAAIEAASENPDDEMYADLEVRLTKARASVGVLAAATVVRSMRLTDEPAVALKAATWYLERSDPDHWDRRALIPPAGNAAVIDVRATLAEIEAPDRAALPA